MRYKYCMAAFAALTILITNCSKKHTPDKTAASTTVTKPIVKKAAQKKKTPVPKVIVVNDNAAKKSFDGRLYYDLEGRRYWKNYSDGKYYLYNQSMYSDSAYVPR